MTPRPRLARSAAWLSVLAASLVACGDDATTTTGGTGGSTTSTGGAESVSVASSSADTGTTTAASSSTGMGTPCTPLKDGVDPNPTPGACDGNVAVTCGQDGFLASESCSGGSSCAEYDLQEWRFDANPTNPMWVKGRTVHWAGCEPPGTEPCTMAWNGNYYDSAEAPHCDGVTRINCLTPPAPQLFDSYPQLVYGTTDGWRVRSDCDPGMKCAGSDALDELTCIAAATPACDGTEPFCSGQGITQCYGTWESQPGYRVVEPCGSGDDCYEGTSGPFCREPGEVPCDDATYGPPHCEADQGSIVSCYDGFTDHQSCAACYDAQGQSVPCRCDDSYSVSGWNWTPGSGYQCTKAAQPACVPQAAGDCDPATDPDTCVGNVAHRCLGHWEDLDCGAQGLVCGVASGLAGCRTAGAAPCDPSYQNHCEGTVMVACCGCGAGQFLFGPTPPSCVPGFEVRSDCADLGASYSCDASGFPFYDVECKF